MTTIRRKRLSETKSQKYHRISKGSQIWCREQKGKIYNMNDLGLYLDYTANK